MKHHVDGFNFILYATLVTIGDRHCDHLGHWRPKLAAKGHDCTLVLVYSCQCFNWCSHLFLYCSYCTLSAGYKYLAFCTCSSLRC